MTRGILKGCWDPYWGGGGSIFFNPLGGLGLEEVRVWAKMRESREVLQKGNRGCRRQQSCVLDFKPTIFVHKNIIGFPKTITERVLSSLYDVETIVINSLDCGLPISRERKYTLCRF